MERTQVAIISADPAGLLLSHLLRRHGIEAVVLEARSREHCEARIRAGVLEQGTREVRLEAGLGERMERQGLIHAGIHLRFDGSSHHIPLSELTAGPRRDDLRPDRGRQGPDRCPVRVGRATAVRVPRRAAWRGSKATSPSSATSVMGVSTSFAARSLPGAMAFTASAVRRARRPVERVGAGVSVRLAGDPG